LVPAASIYLKNRVMKGWQPAEDFTGAKAIPEEEKGAFRNRLVPIIASSTSPSRAQLIAVLQKVLSSDFPTKWPGFLDITIQLLNAQDANSVFAGEQCLLSICKIYRFLSGDSRRDFDKIVAMTFPQLLSIGNSLANETSPQAGEMLHTCMKIFKHAIYVSLFVVCPWHALTTSLLVRTTDSFERAASHGWLVHAVSHSRVKRSTRVLHARRHSRARDKLVVERKEMGLLQPEQALHEVKLLIFGRGCY
jgi:hypothetical protein